VRAFATCATCDPTIRFDRQRPQGFLAPFQSSALLARAKPWQHFPFVAEPLEAWTDLRLGRRVTLAPCKTRYSLTWGVPRWRCSHPRVHDSLRRERCRAHNGPRR